MIFASTFDDRRRQDVIKTDRRHMNTLNDVFGNQVGVRIWSKVLPVCQFWLKIPNKSGKKGPFEPTKNEQTWKPSVC